MENREYLKAHLKSAAQIFNRCGHLIILVSDLKKFFFKFSYENLFIDLPLQFDKKKVEMLQNN